MLNPQSSMGEEDKGAVPSYSDQSQTNRLRQSLLPVVERQEPPQFHLQGAGDVQYIE
jgi:hypothetical protein